MREDQLFTRPTIELRSQHEINTWIIAAWVATIIALGTVGAVAFAMPEIVNRVNVAERAP